MPSPRSGTADSLLYNSLILFFENMEEGTDESVIEDAAVVATIFAGCIGND